MKCTNGRVVGKISFCVVIVFLLLMPINTYSQSKMSIGAGFDIMLPTGSFGDHWNTGFGGTAEFDYMITQHASVTGKIGYLSWSGKNLPTGVSASYGGVPLLVGVKYFFRFIPQGTVHVYGHFELGMMFGSVSVSGNNYPVFVPGGSAFTIVPSLGAEIPITANGDLDLSIRFFDISRKGNIGFRLGYKMPI